jgi:uncharacterized protein (UPF0261 family)
MTTETTTTLPTSRELVQKAEHELAGMTDLQCRDALGFLIGFTAVKGVTQPCIQTAIAWAKAKEEAK